MKNLLRQISDDVVSNLITLSLYNETNELSHRFRHVVLIIEEVYDFLNACALHILEGLAVLVHAKLQNVEQDLFKICNLDELLVLEEVETRSDETLDVVFVDLLVNPQHMHVFLQNTLQNLTKDFLAGHGDCILSQLVVFLVFCLVLLRHFLLAFGEIGLLVLLQAAVI